MGRWSKERGLVVVFILVLVLTSLGIRVSGYWGLVPGVITIVTLQGSGPVRQITRTLTCGSNQRLIGISLQWVVTVSFLALFDSRCPLVSFRLFKVSFSRSKQNVVTPTPTNELPQLLENQQVKNPSRSHLIIIIVGNTFPM